MNTPKILDESEIETRISKLSVGWELKNGKLTKTFEFGAIMDGIHLLDKLIPYCNEIDHHPDIHIYFKKFIFELSRWDAGGKVTDRDFVVAEKIEELVKSR